MTHRRATLQWRSRALQWVARYGAAEAGGLGLAFLVAGAVALTSGDRVLAAYGGAVGETTGFYAVMAFRQIVADRRESRRGGKSYGGRQVTRSLHALVVELGPSELADVTFVRPAAMAAGMTAFGPQVGLLAGKLAADTVFYGLAILAFERRRASALRDGAGIGVLR